MHHLPERADLLHVITISLFLFLIRVGFSKKPTTIPLMKKTKIKIVFLVTLLMWGKKGNV